MVLATGFRVDRFLRPMQVIGRAGRRLDGLWAERPVAYLSISIPGFPNLFMLNGPNGPVGNFSLIEVAELQIAYILDLIEPIRAGRCREISASDAATAAYPLSGRGPSTASAKRWRRRSSKPTNRSAERRRRLMRER